VRTAARSRRGGGRGRHGRARTASRGPASRTEDGSEVGECAGARCPQPSLSHRPDPEQERERLGHCLRGERPVGERETRRVGRDEGKARAVRRRHLLARSEGGRRGRGDGRGHPRSPERAGQAGEVPLLVHAGIIGPVPGFSFVAVRREGRNRRGELSGVVLHSAQGVLEARHRGEYRGESVAAANSTPRTSWRHPLLTLELRTWL